MPSEIVASKQSIFKDKTTFYFLGTTGDIAFNSKTERLGNVFILEMNRRGKFMPVQMLHYDKAGTYNDMVSLNLVCDVIREM